MLAYVLMCSAIVADPVAMVQLRYPAHRVVFVTSFSFNVVYTVPPNAPPELKRAYKVLEVAEREVLITEALQLFRAEIISNERWLETLRTVRMAAALTDARSSGNRIIFYDPTVFAPPESTLKARLSDALGEDAKVERALLALDRLVEAHYQVYQTLFFIAHPEKRPAPGKLPEPKPLPLPGGAVPAPPGNIAIAEAEKAEKVAANAELVAEQRERDARAKERAADVKYRDAEAADRPVARAAWLKARDAWEKARNDWDATRDQWQAARDQLNVLRKAQRTPAIGLATRPVQSPK
jgi:hypothetical protein